MTTSSVESRYLGISVTSSESSAGTSGTAGSTRSILASLRCCASFAMSCQLGLFAGVVVFAIANQRLLRPG